MIHFYTSLIITVVPYPGEPGTEVSEPRYLSETLPIQCVQADFFFLSLKVTTHTRHAGLFLLHFSVACSLSHYVSSHIYCTCMGYECSNSSFRPHLSNMRHCIACCYFQLRKVHSNLCCFFCRSFCTFPFSPSQVVNLLPQLWVTYLFHATLLVAQQLLLFCFTLFFFAFFTFWLFCWASSRCRPCTSRSP